MRCDQMPRNSMRDEPTNLPCPFCGADVDPTGWLTTGGVRGPECEDCGATAPTVATWNARACIGVNLMTAEIEDLHDAKTDLTGGRKSEDVIRELQDEPTTEQIQNRHNHTRSSSLFFQFDRIDLDVVAKMAARDRGILLKRLAEAEAFLEESEKLHSIRIDAARELSTIYFDIAEEFISADEIRKRRDKMIGDKE